MAALMTDPRRRMVPALAGLAWLLAALSGLALSGAGPATAEPAEPAPPPPPTLLVPPPEPAPKNPMTPHQPAVPVGEPGDAPPIVPNFQPSVPEIPNAQYGSGKYGGGVLGTLRDLWDQARNPMFAQDEIMGVGSGRPSPPPGAGPAPPLPPGYVSTNAPGSETPSTSTGGGSEAGRPALPPGYYPLDGPPPPGYEYLTPSGS